MPFRPKFVLRPPHAVREILAVGHQSWLSAIMIMALIFNNASDGTVLWLQSKAGLDEALRSTMPPRVRWITAVENHDQLSVECRTMNVPSPVQHVRTVLRGSQGNFLACRAHPNIASTCGTASAATGTAR